jgi:hypothetical protein
MSSAAAWIGAGVLLRRVQRVRENGFCPPLSATRLLFRLVAFRPVQAASYFFGQATHARNRSSPVRLRTMEFHSRKISLEALHHGCTVVRRATSHRSENGVVENLMDFSFERLVTPRMLKMLSAAFAVGLDNGDLVRVQPVPDFEIEQSAGLTTGGM